MSTKMPTGVPRNYPAFYGVGFAIALQTGVSVATSNWGPWYVWVGLAVFGVLAMEVTGVSVHSSWMGQMDAQLERLDRLRITLLTKIDHLRVAADVPDTRMDRLKSAAKGVANVAVTAAAAVAAIGGKVAFGAAVGGGGFDVATIAKDAALDTGVEVLKHAGSNHRPKAIDDASLPSERASRDLVHAEAALADLYEVVATLKARRSWRERWRARVLVDTLLWAVAGGGVAAFLSLAGAAN